MEKAILYVECMIMHHYQATHVMFGLLSRQAASQQMQVHTKHFVGEENFISFQLINFL